MIDQEDEDLLGYCPECKNLFCQCLEDWQEFKKNAYISQVNEIEEDISSDELPSDEDKLGW